jgi:hypothetical protein
MHVQRQQQVRAQAVPAAVARNQPQGRCILPVRSLQVQVSCLAESSRARCLQEQCNAERQAVHHVHCTAAGSPGQHITSTLHHKPAVLAQSCPCTIDLCPGIAATASTLASCAWLPVLCPSRKQRRMQRAEHAGVGWTLLQCPHLSDSSHLSRAISVRQPMCALPKVHGDLMLPLTMRLLCCLHLPAYAGTATSGCGGRPSLGTR